MFWHVLNISVLQYYFGCVWTFFECFGALRKFVMVFGANAMVSAGTEGMRSMIK